jgi:DNA ligase-associated metallophosphoesterase
VAGRQPAPNRQIRAILHWWCRVIPAHHDQQIRIESEQFYLLPERAMFWPDRRMVIVTDLHLGRTIPTRGDQDETAADTTRTELIRLSDLLQRTGAAHLLILGDLIHSRAPGREEALAAFAAWRAAHPMPTLTLIRGNHDRQGGDPPDSWAVRCEDEPLTLGPFAFQHYPRSASAGYVVAGHLHPAVVLAGPRRRRLRFPCFWFGHDMALLPAFGRGLRTSVIRAQPGDRVFVVSDDAVLAVRR